MPEGPEIRRAADSLNAVLQHETIEAVELNLPSIAGWANTITGTRVEAVTCHGKAMLTHFSNGKTLYSHNQLYGVWKIASRGSYPDTGRALRVALHTGTHSALLYSATDIDIWETAALPEHPFLKKLGPDVLDPRLTATMIAERLQSDAFHRRSLASLYLDQGFIAGIGNYLRSEILFAAKVSPTAKASELSAASLTRLAGATLRVSQRSYRTGGITISRAASRRLAASGGGFERYRFAVFNRDGEACINCGASIRKADMTARRIYWCPVCQPSP